MKFQFGIEIFGIPLFIKNLKDVYFSANFIVVSMILQHLLIIRVKDKNTSTTKFTESRILENILW